MPLRPAIPCPVCGREDRKCQYGDSGVLVCRVTHDPGEPVNGYRFLKLSPNPYFADWVPDGPRVPAPYNKDRQAERDAERQAEAAVRLEDFERAVGGDNAFVPLMDVPELSHPASGRAFWKRLFGNAIAYDHGAVSALCVRHLSHDGSNSARKKPCWAVPMFDGKTRHVGWSLRYPDGRKLSRGANGLFIPLTLPTDHPKHDRTYHEYSPLFIVEGASDTLAMQAMGLPAVGRPSAAAGAEMIAEFVRRRMWPYDVLEPKCGVPHIFVVAENDSKESKSGERIWPGRDGCVSVGQQIHNALGVEVGGVMLPQEYKDVRDWLRARAASKGRPSAKSLGVSQFWPMAASQFCNGE